MTWPTKKLGNKKYFEILGSGINKFEGEKEYLSTSSIGNNEIIMPECKITYNQKPSRANMQPRLNSVWFAKMKNTIKVYSFTQENKNEINQYILSTGFVGILCNTEKVSPKYLEKIFLSNWFNKQKDEITHGSTQKAINNKDLANLEIPLPPLSIQQKIVEILDTIQEGVKTQEKIIEKTKELKKAMMQEIFNPTIKNQKSKIQFKIQKWEYLKKIANIIMGQSPPSQFYNTKKDGLSFLQGKAEFGEKFPSPKKWCTRPIKIARKGDILISVRAPVGDVNLADQNYCIGRGLAAIKPNHNLDNFYLFEYLQISKEKLVNKSSGSTFKAIDKETLGNFKVPIMSINQQREIAEILQTIDEKIEVEEKKKALYEELFKTMLNKLMSGEIDVEKF